MYDEGARSWACDIEAKLRELEGVEARLRDAEKRREKLRSKKYVEEAEAELRDLRARQESLKAFTSGETERFFQTVLGILPESIVALVDADGRETLKVIASSMRVRTLKNGQLVTSVWGDLVEGESGDRLSNTLLMAAEAEGKRLKALS